MDVTAVLLGAAAILGWGAVSARVTRADLTAPIVFVAAGGLLALLGLVDRPSAPETLRPLVELALVAANAHKEGGFAGVGGTRVSPAEAVAIARVKQAAGIP